MTRSILIVDDIPANRKILGGMLRRDYSIREVGGGEEALALLRQERQEISAVLLDISMPGMDGYEVLRQIRADAALLQLPVIMVTGTDDEEARVKSLALGANDFVMKPYSSAIIKHCLRNNIALYEASTTLAALQRDKLTGLYNREAFFDKVSELVAQQPAGYYTMTCFDVDKFKIINDQYGTNKGDQVLQHIAQTFLNGFRPQGGICCRIAGDRFAVLYPAAFSNSQQIVAIRQQAAQIEGLVSPIIFSIGRYLITDPTLPPSTMYDWASLAAESIKGRYDVKIAQFDSTMRDKLIQEQELVMEMDGALQNRQFEVWFQPQYNHTTGAMIGAEALVRWRHPTKGLIPPGAFIPTFEKNGFVYELDKYVWEETCRYLRRWLDTGRSPLPISVNISRYDIFCFDIIQNITGLVERYAIPVGLLRLEITESAFAESTQQIIQVVRQLVDRGFTVEIDDFGSGYSSLNTLKDVPAQVIKLDMRFLQSSASQRGGNIVESVVRMARWLGMSVIAEGVETLAQADYLRSVGCSYIQGYLYARPMGAEQYEAHCAGTQKEEKLLALETVENLDNNAFWNPESMDTLIFNSYVGGACIYEYHNGSIELLRATQKYAQVIGSAGMTVEDALKLKWTEYLDEDSRRQVIQDLEESVSTRKEVTGEYVFLDLPGCSHETYLRSTMRVIAKAGDRYLVYCTNENFTAQRISERRERESANQARRMAEQLQAILDNVDLGITATVVKDDGVQYLLANDRYYTLLGYTRRQFEAEVGDPFINIAPEDREKARQDSRALARVGDAAVWDYRAIRRDGSSFWLRAAAAIARFTGIDEPVQLAIFRDITADKLAEHKLEEASRQLQTILDNLPGGAAVYQYNGQTLSAVHLNKRYWEQVNRPAVAYQEASFLRAVHPDDRDTVMRELKTAIHQNRDIECDLRVLYGQNSYRPFHVTGRLVPQEDGTYYVYATYTALDEAVMSYQQMLPVVLSTIMESTSDLSFAKDKSFRYLCASRAFVAMAGCANESQVIGKTDFDLFEPAIAAKYRQDDEALLREGRSIVDMVETIPSQDEMPRYSSTSKYLLRDTAGEVIGLYGVGRDVTAALTNSSRLQFVNDNIPGGLVTYTWRDGVIRIAYCNDGFCRLFGGTREGFAQRGDFDPVDWVFPEDRAALLNQVEALVRDDTPVDHIYRIHVLGGGYKWINEKAVATRREEGVVQFSAVLLDVTGRQNAIEQLRISEEENLLAVQLNGSVIGRYTLADRSLSISPEAAAASGLPQRITNVPEEPIHLGMISSESADAYTGFFEAIRHGSRAASAVFQQRYLNNWRWMEAKGSTVFSNDGKPVKAVISFCDVTERLEKETVYKKWQQSLEAKPAESYTLFRCNLSKDTSFDTREGGLLRFDSDRSGLDFNGQTRAYVNGWVHPGDRDTYIAFLNADTLLGGYYRGRRSDTLEYRELLPDGDYRWLRLTVDLVEYPNSTDVEAYLMYENIDAAKRVELQTRELAQTDPLTGVLNRVTFAARVEKIIRASRPETRHALLLLDIDGFKQVNDVFGHSAGDETLIGIASAMRAVLRREDLIARLGGDEFLVLLTNIADDKAAANKAGQLCALTRKAFSLEVQISGSVGVAMTPRDGIDFETLYKKADAALYHVKGSGKDNYALYRDSMADEHLRPEADTGDQTDASRREKKRRMLIVEDDPVNQQILMQLFQEDFICEKAGDGNSALIRLRHYGSAISVVLLDLTMPGLDGFAVLEKLQSTTGLRDIPVIIVSGDDSRETCLKAIRAGATDFVTKPVEPGLLRLRVQSAVSRSENERLRARNNLLELQNEERIRYEAAIESAGVAVTAYNWLQGTFTYAPSMSRHVAGTYDSRSLWSILLSDQVADTETVQTMQELVHQAANDRESAQTGAMVKLKAPDGQIHLFRMNVRKLVQEYQSPNSLILTLTDLNAPVAS